MCEWACAGQVAWRLREFPSEPLPLPNPNLLLARNCRGPVHPFPCLLPGHLPCALSPSAETSERNTKPSER